MVTTFSFALPSGYDWDIKKFTKDVKTIKWCKQYDSQLERYRELITTQCRDNRQVIGGMLQAAYGANIGKQIEEKLTEKDIEKIKLNLIKTA